MVNYHEKLKQVQVACRIIGNKARVRNLEIQSDRYAARIMDSRTHREGLGNEQPDNQTTRRVRSMGDTGHNVQVSSKSVYIHHF